MGKLTFKDKIGYGSAAIGDSVAYMLINTFLLFFLTTVAGIQPAAAGALTAVGAIWNALFNPIMGYISDHAKTRWGRRRPFMLGFCIPIALCMVLLFTAVEINYTVRIIYYGGMIIAFWTSFTGFFVPYYALGAEYTNDYEERTSIRSYASFFNIIGTCFSMGMPSILVKIFNDAGISTEHAWTMTAAFLGLIEAISIIITAIAAKDKDPANLTCDHENDSYVTAKAENSGAFSSGLERLGNNADEITEDGQTKSIEATVTGDSAGTAGSFDSAISPAAGGLSGSEAGKKGIISMFREYLQVLSLKPILWLLLCSLFYLIAYVMYLSDLVYFLTYNVHFSSGGISAAMLLRSVVAMLIIPPVAGLCRITDKRTALLWVMAVGSAGCIITRFLPLGDIALAVIIIVVTTVITATYWQIVPALYYDVCEYDEYETGMRREGAIVSIQGLIESIASGIGTQILGIILQFGGFDGSADVQSEAAQGWVYNCTTWIPVIALAIAAFALIKYPITRQKYQEILRELEKRHSGTSSASSDVSPENEKSPL